MANGYHKLITTFFPPPTQIKIVVFLLLIYFLHLSILKFHWKSILYWFTLPTIRVNLKNIVILIYGPCEIILVSLHAHLQWASILWSLDYVIALLEMLTCCQHVNDRLKCHEFRGILCCAESHVCESASFARCALEWTTNKLALYMLFRIFELLGIWGIYSTCKGIAFLEIHLFLA